MVDNSLSDARYCPICNKEIEYDGTCGCVVDEEELTGEKEGERRNG